ncbi:MAG: hypothetical protein RIR00_822 [Pseudomonadota bacterium]|jgi:hypothetical protein
MTTPVFPSYAQILLVGFGEKRQSALIRTEMEDGPPKQARIRSRVLVTRPCSIRLRSSADYQSFVAWYSTTLREGTQWFDWTDPVTGSTVSARFSGGGLDAAPDASVSGVWVIRGLNIETWG